MTLSRKIGWGISGAGDIAERVTAPAMRRAPNCQLVAVARRDLFAASEFARRHGAQRAYGSVGELVFDSEVDAVYIATPVARHLPDTLAAARAGKHVLCEKPLALTAAEGEEMRRACELAGVVLMPCFYQRFNARHRKIQELLAEGAVGTVTAVRVNFSGRNPGRPGDWRQNPAQSGGGCYIDNGSHAIDLLRFFFGEIIEVVAFTDTLAAQYLVEDTASSILRLRGGAHAVVTSWWSTGDPDEDRNSVIEIHGTEGIIISSPLHDKFSRGQLQVLARGRVESFEFVESTHEMVLEAFCYAVTEQRPPPITARDGIAALRVVEAVYESSRTRRVVMLGAV